MWLFGLDSLTAGWLQGIQTPYLEPRIPKMSVPENNEEAVSFFLTASKIRQHNFHWILSSQWVTSMLRFKGKRYKHHLFMLRVSKSVCPFIETTTDPNKFPRLDTTRDFRADLSHNQQKQSKKWKKKKQNCSVKDNMKRTRQALDWEKIFAKDISIENCYPK